MVRSVVTTGFRIVIPKEIREKTGLRRGQLLQVICRGGVISLVPDRPVSKCKGLARHVRSFGFREKRDRF